MKDLLTSTEAARLAGVGTTAIKRWSDAQVLPCVKTGGGHRRFRRVDVERLVRSGVAVEARRWDEWVDALVNRPDPHALLARLYEWRAREGAWHRVMHELGGLVKDLGVRWAQGVLTVGEEHIASAGLERALASLCALFPSTADAPVCLLATAEGDEHTLGLSLVEVCLCEAGWRAQWVGGRTRAGDVTARIAAGGLSMVALSASVHMSDARVLAEEASVVGEACRTQQIPLALGGSAPWPDAPAYGTRFHDVIAFYDFALAAREQSDT